MGNVLGCHCHGTLNSAAIRPFGRCHPYYLVYSKYLGAMTISWENCLAYCLVKTLLMAYHTSYHINTSLLFSHVMFWFSGKVIFLLVFTKQLGPWICYIFHNNQKVHRAHKGLTHLRFVFLFYLKQGSGTW